MPGFTTESGKFIMPLSEKMTYANSADRCDGLGLQIHLPQTKTEQAFVNSLTQFSSNWLRIMFDKNEVFTNDKFKEIVPIELWDEKPYSIAGDELQSAINIAGQYWQGLRFQSYHMLHSIYNMDHIIWSI